MTSLSVDFLPAASVSGERFREFFNGFYFPMSMVVFVVTLGAAIYFALKYKRKREGEATPYISHNYLVEFTSVFLISIVVGISFIWGWRDYKDEITPRMNAYEINIIGQQWSWTVQYSNGKTLTNEIYLPNHQQVRLIMTSKDVIHSFFIPAFRQKEDVLPGQFTSLNFEPTVAGDYDLFCAEYCGTSHSGMIGRVHVLEHDDWQKWLDGTYKAPKEAEASGSSQPKRSLADAGAALYRSKTCVTCHSVDGSRVVGPTFKGLWGSKQDLVSGDSVTVDENYIRESLMDPMKKIVKGYPPAMPTFRGMLSDEEVNQLIAYLKSLK